MTRAHIVIVPLAAIQASQCMQEANHDHHDSCMDGRAWWSAFLDSRKKARKGWVWWCPFMSPNISDLSKIWTCLHLAARAELAKISISRKQLVKRYKDKSGKSRVATWNYFIGCIYLYVYCSIYHAWLQKKIEPRLATSQHYANHKCIQWASPTKQLGECFHWHFVG